MMLLDRLLGTSFFMPAIVEMGTPAEIWRWKSNSVPAPVLVLRAPGGLHRRVTGLRPGFRSDQHPRKTQHLWLSNDGMGDRGHRRPEFRGLGPPHVRKRDEPRQFGFFFATTTLIIAIPTAIKVYNWVLTLWRGDIHFTTPMLFAIGFIVTFVNGGLTGLFLGNVVVDVPLSDTMFVVAHFHMVMGVAPILVVFGSIYHWYPKVTGRLLDEGLGTISFLGDIHRCLRDLFSDALSRIARRAPALFRMGRNRFHSGVRPHAECIYQRDRP